ncbi:MAG: hypothetical protein EZS28_017433 [Streblomastix strix]|uniref:Uncharacterized protein n=1 Tax=Streblomastix strix TaxID=222440 RepID=A0A5J4VWV9_9EUKA|nr:MAG: hypothetical protein EZS28_017433 [Streblomastix strix]
MCWKDKQIDVDLRCMFKNLWTISGVVAIKKQKERMVQSKTLTKPQIFVQLIIHGTGAAPCAGVEQVAFYAREVGELN